MMTLLLLCLAQLAPAQELGRLFFSAAERAELDRLRYQRNHPDLTQAVVEVIEELIQTLPLEDEPEETPPDIIYALGGSVRNGNGSYTVWLNNEPINAGLLPDHIELLRPFAAGQVRITNLDTGQGFIVKPGQVLNLTQGRLMESYEVQEVEDAAVPEQLAAAVAPAQVQAQVQAPVNDAEAVNEEILEDIEDDELDDQ